MKSPWLRRLVLLGFALLLGGCASFDAGAPQGSGLANLQRFFVVSNLNDNHALDQRIATALEARGLVAGSGPLTMMPDNTQAIVTFQDNWAWDFGEHLVFLKLAVHKPDSNEIIASAVFSARIPLKEAPPIIMQLVGRLFDNKNSAPGPASPLTAPDSRTETKRRAR